MRLIKLLTSLAVLFWAGASFAAGRDARVRRALLESCPQSQTALLDLTAEAWRPVEDAVAAHRALRRRLGAEIPEAQEMILIHGVSSHHVTWEISTAAVRGADGRWRIDTVIEERAGLLRMEPKVHPRETRALSARRGRWLDDLLQDRCLYAEPDLQSHSESVDAYYSTMDIITPSRRRTVAWVGRSQGVTGAVARLIMGRDKN